MRSMKKPYVDSLEKNPDWHDEWERGIKAKKAGFKYLIQVKPGVWEGYEFSLDMEKTYGDSSGSYTGAKNVEDAIKTIKDFLKRCEGFDTIVERMGDKVTEKTLYVYSCTPKITVGKLLTGQVTLFG